MFSGQRLWLAATLALLLGCGQAEQTPTRATPAMPSLVGQPAPKMEGALTWLNSPELTAASLSGKVALIEFFDYSCVNCIRTYPYMLEWSRRYAPLGLQVIGVHSPQYEFEMDPNNVRKSVQRYGLTYPIAIDSYLKLAAAYNNRYWPRLFVIDRAGVIRFDHTGEGGYADAEQMIQTLLRDADPGVKLPPLLPPIHDSDKPGAVCYPMTPELYVGRARGNLANPEAALTNAMIHFEPPATHEEGKIVAAGDWTVRDEYMRHAVDKDDLSDFLTLKYRAIEFNVVMKPESIYWMQVFVDQDGKPVPRANAGSDVTYDENGRSYIKVDEARMYNITSKQPFGVHEIRLSVRGKGLSVYSFSFGTCAMSPDGDTLKATKESS